MLKLDRDARDAPNQAAFASRDVRNPTEIADM
jgi:hypothetical protein